jgi:hypothetical protein
MLINIRRALVAIVFIRILRVIFIKNYTEIFQVVYEVNVPFIQCEMRLYLPASLEIVHGLAQAIFEAVH